MKITTSLLEYLQTELINEGHNEFFNNDQLTFYDDEFAFMQKIYQLDDDVLPIVNRRIFKGFKLDDPEADYTFKRGFLARFLARQINPQTIDLFAGKVLATGIVLKDYMDIAFVHAKDFMVGGTDNLNKKDREDNTDRRALLANLPQDMFNINVNDDVMKTANENTISKDRLKSTETDTQKGKNYDINKFKETFYMIDRIYEEFDRKCFLHVW